MAATRRAALMAAPALVAVGAAPSASPLLAKAAQLPALQAAVDAAYPPAPYTLAEEDAAMPRIEAAIDRLDDARWELSEIPARSFAELLAKARAAYAAAEKDVTTGVMRADDAAQALLVSVLEDVLALGGCPVPRGL